MADKIELTGEETTILTICYQKPGTTEEIASETGKELTELEPILESLKGKGLIKESSGSWQSTQEGDFFIEGDKDPNEE